MKIEQKRIKIICIVGTRPQFIKHAAIEQCDHLDMEFITVHTSQHYDDDMSDVFFKQLDIKTPKYQLINENKANSQEHNEYMLKKLNEIFFNEQPTAVLVYGDTDSTLAGARAAEQLQLPVIHVEAGLRSYNEAMQEEINRVKTDQISTLLLVPNETARLNLEREGISGSGIVIVGDVMKDVIGKRNTMSKNQKSTYHYATLHRPYNVDEERRLVYILDTLNTLNQKVILSIHPRTKSRILAFGLDLDKFENINFIGPQSYFDNLNLMAGSTSIITDSGGMQKEAYWLEKPCVTLRPETEWRETLVNQCNILIYENLEKLEELIQRPFGPFDPDLYGDGCAAQKIIESIYNRFQ
ncbi:MAG TPA: UDP-N-acetylglucosamine 2-epimerase (non-hydrolyzing) [Saprospiraceae bacterium]|nr:UDP-N-acetylglucosamine 2-epimerase (non-hydrolyzing) [Saprospiraceae bacterium]HPN68134.1 UDP-N-acetylglucosamine 2-epimerase (non-hydrolyzing) [Saprospiraceae bacterium]